MNTHKHTSTLTSAFFFLVFRAFSTQNNADLESTRVEDRFFCRFTQDTVLDNKTINSIYINLIFRKESVFYYSQMQLACSYVVS